MQPPPVACCAIRLAGDNQRHDAPQCGVRARIVREQNALITRSLLGGLRTNKMCARSKL